jgi:hypothetical protein
MNQIERITYYENNLNEVAAVLKEFDKAFDAFADIQGKISELDKYYTSPEWKEDFEASEKNELPKDLYCGVLSEDGIDHMLDDNQQLFSQCKMIEAVVKVNLK